MSEKVVLPKFDLPGSGPHPAMKALYAGAALLAVSMAVLGGALWRHHSMQAAAEARAQALIAARTAEANAAAEAAKARAVEAAAQVALERAKAEQERMRAKNAIALAAVTAESATGKPSAAHHRGRHHLAKAAVGGKGSKTIARANAADDKGEKKPAAQRKKGDDAIDKLLASFK